MTNEKDLPYERIEVTEVEPRSFAKGDKHWWLHGKALVNGNPKLYGFNLTVKGRVNK